ncbi:MAG: hypothetical protein JNG85_02540 [Spirochaetaceae bacterium]|nr:hypothetical protein [Spirochaetaceae bacterium]
MNAGFRPKAHAAPALSFLAAVLCAACWVPSCDPAISLSAKFEKKLERVSRIGPVSASGDYPTDGRFYARLVPVPTEGYWIREGFDSVGASYIQRQPDGRFLVMASWGQGREKGIPSLVFARPVPTTLPEDRSLIVMVGRGSSGVQLLSYSAGMIAGGPAPNWTMPDPAERLIAAGSASYAGGAASGAFIHTWTAVPPLRSNIQVYDLTNGTTSPTGTNTNLYSGPTLYGPGFYAFNSTNSYHYLSAYEGNGAIRAFRWVQPPNAAAPIALTGVDRMLTALLHDDRLMAQDEATTQVYDPLGAPLFLLTTGALRFSHELLVGGTWYCYFTRSVAIRGKDFTEYYADVFRFPTARLAELAQP